MPVQDQVFTTLIKIQWNLLFADIGCRFGIYLLPMLFKKDTLRQLWLLTVAEKS